MDRITEMLEDDANVFEMDYGDAGGPVTLKEFDQEKIPQYLKDALSSSSTRQPSTTDPHGRIRFAIQRTGELGTTEEAIEALEESFVAFGLPKQTWYVGICGRINLPATWAELEKSRLSMRPVTKSLSFETIGVVWRYFPESCDTVGLIWYEADEEVSRVKRILAILNERQHPVPHSAVISLASISAMLEHMEQRVMTVKMQLNNLQEDTGLKSYNGSRTGEVDPDTDLAVLSARVSGRACNWLERSRRVAVFSAFVKEIIADCESRAYENPNFHDDRAHVYFEQHARNVYIWSNDMAETLNISNASMSVLIQGVFNLIAQRDTRANFAIAKASKRDSTAMKAIAILTMVFLPGTFIASFLAMPLFDVDESTGVLSSRNLWIYWTITIPLTILVLCIWAAWERFSRKRNELRLSMMNLEDGKTV